MFFHLFIYLRRYLCFLLIWLSPSLSSLLFLNLFFFSILNRYYDSYSAVKICEWLELFKLYDVQVRFLFSFFPSCSEIVSVPSLISLAR
jgi:hypothetical protein